MISPTPRRIDRIMQGVTCLLITLCIAGLAAIGAWNAVHADEPTPITVRTGTYHLDNGDAITWWLDEPRGLLCLSIADSASSWRASGLTCVPLDTTTYGLPAIAAP